MLNTVTLTMTDAQGKEVIRTIDSTCAMTSGSECWEVKWEGSQRARLEEWIAERGNPQHNTKLTLKHWTFSFKKGIYS